MTRVIFDRKPELHQGGLFDNGAAWMEAAKQFAQGHGGVLAWRVDRTFKAGARWFRIDWINDQWEVTKLPEEQGRCASS